MKRRDFIKTLIVGGVGVVAAQKLNLAVAKPTTQFVDMDVACMYNTPAFSPESAEKIFRRTEFLQKNNNNYFAGSRSMCQQAQFSVQLKDSRWTMVTQ